MTEGIDRFGAVKTTALDSGEKRHSATKLILIRVFTLWAISGIGHGEPRTFINRDGKKIVADVLRVEKDFVILRKGVRDFRTAIALLSDADQEFIREWAENNVVYKIDVRTAKEKTGKTGPKRNAGYQVTENWRYNLELTNRDFSEIGPLTARYMMIGKMTSTVRGRLRTRGNRKTERIVTGYGEFTVPELGSTRATIHQTVPLALLQEKRIVETVTGFDKNNKPLTSSSTFKTNSYLAGIWIKLYDEKGREVFEHKSSYPQWDEVPWNYPEKK